MEWLTNNWLLLICPLMMIFCMFGMGGHKHKHHDSHLNKDMDCKMSKLELENEKLRKELDALSALVKKDA